MDKTTKPLIISLIVNVILTIMKLIFGILSGFSSLIADGLHSLSDLSTDLIGIIGNKLSLKPEDEEHPFGHGKTEYITSLIIGILIILLGLKIALDVFGKKPTIPNVWISLTIVFAIIIKYILGTYLTKKGEIYKNNILIASGKESKADSISSIFVLVSLILMQFSNSFSIFKYADILGTIIISIFIIKTGVYILKINGSVLLEEQIIDLEYYKKIEDIIYSFEGIVNIEKLFILRYGCYYKLISDITMKENILLNDAHKIIDQIEIKIRHMDDKIKYIFIHMEPLEKKLEI